MTTTIQLEKEEFLANKELANYDYDFLCKLQSMFDYGEGALFNWRSCDSAVHQINFHKKWLSEINPNYILETGTYKGFYSYFVKNLLPNVKVYTFGINEESQLCVDAINEFYNENFITFFSGDSKKTLTNFDNPDNIKFDVAWVDGGHSYDCAISDLINCANLGIEKILIDDCDLAQVAQAVDEFLNTSFSPVEGTEEYMYVIKDQSPYERKIIFMERTLV